ncbi:MAG TPA: DUF58 domain-containing protein [Longimicrobiales bacterium]|nr:DUF58 domain-containing protein [Longimicrobiales bacterium]
MYGRVRRAWLRLRRWLRPPRRLTVLRPGGFLIFGTFALGLATLNTGNNLLYLLMGALLGTIALSGWLSEQALRELRIRRIVPRAITAGEHARIDYEITNRKRNLPSHGIEVRELVDADEITVADRAGALHAEALQLDAGFIAALEPGATARARAPLTAPRRGVIALDGVTLTTAFPFGLFAKERDIELPGSLTVWPRADRKVRAPRLGGRRGQRQQLGVGAAAGAERGDYRGLRQYRPGDDPRDIHWRSSARRGEPIIREYDRDAADEYWIVLDTVAPDEAAGEAAVEIAASVIALAAERGDRFGVAAGAARIQPGVGSARVDAALDVLAAINMTRTGAEPALPARAESCVLVTARAAGGTAWGDLYHATEDAA